MASGALEQSVTEDDHFNTGEDRVIIVDCTDAAGARLQMSGWSLEYKVLSIYDGSALVTKTTGGGGIVISSSLGDATLDRATITIASANTSSASPGTHRHYLRRTGSGTRNVLMEGPFVLRASVDAWT